MPALVVGGVTIKVAREGVQRDRDDASDRSRAFDNTYRASVTGTAKRTWAFSTPPLARATADTYEATLGVVSPQTCSGDILGASISCCSEITGNVPLVIGTAQYSVISFALSEV